MPSHQHCANCGATVSRAFCASCGQSVHEGHSPSLSHLLHELTHEFLHVDGKIFRSVKALLLEPGRLTREYWDGHVVRWVRPLRLFLIAAALHLFFATGVGPINLQFDAYRQVDSESISLSAHDAFGEKKNPNLRPLEKEQKEVLSRTFEHAYLAVRYFSPFVFAFFCWALYRRRQPHFVQHLTGALHFYAFWYLIAIAAGLLSRWNPYLQFLGVLSLPYLAMTLRRLYGLSWLRAIAGTAALYVGLLLLELFLALLAMTVAIRQAKILFGG